MSSDFLTWDEEIDDLFESFEGSRSEFEKILNDLTFEQNSLVVFTDGSYFKNSNDSSFSTLCVSSFSKELKRKISHCKSWYHNDLLTNFAMEAKAVYETLKLCNKFNANRIIIYTDCFWLIQSLSCYKNNDDKIEDLKYHSLISKIKKISENRSVSFGFIPSHSKDPNASPFKTYYNEKVDTMCSNVYRKYKPSRYPKIRKHRIKNDNIIKKVSKPKFKFYRRDLLSRFRESRRIYTIK